MNADEWEIAAGRLVAAFPQQAVAEETLALYGEVFMRWDTGLFNATLRVCMDRYHWLPSIHQFRTVALELLVEAKLMLPDAATAWLMVLDAAKRWYDPEAQAALPDEIRRALSRAGGMQRINESQSDYERERIREHFTAVYNQGRRIVEDIALHREYAFFEPSNAPALEPGHKAIKR